MIKIDDFIGIINIPDLYGDAAANQAIREKFNLYIADYTEYFLRDLFGDDFYDSYASDITGSAVTKWVDLRAKLTKPCARYIYFNFIRHNTTQTTPGGEVQANFENAVIVTNQVKLIEQWNRMSTEAGRVIEFLQDNPTDYPDFDYYDTLMENGLHPLSKISIFQ